MVDIKIQLPDSFFEEEERWGYKTSKKMKEVWAIQLDLLCEFDRVCKKLGIKYFLDSGTLLGAVRDGRFIPWDDDIDVVMLREDYDQLLKDGPGEFTSPMFLQNAYTDNDYRRGLTQLRRSDTTFILKREVEKKLPFDQGICIDIFPLDGLAPQEELEQHFREKQIIRKKIGDIAKEPGHDPVEVRERFRQYERISSRYRDAKIIDPVMYHRDTQSLFSYRREWFVKTVEIPFEGRLFPVPENYHKVLECRYGSDYLIPRMIPTDHGEVIIDTDLSYKEVFKTLENSNI